MPCTPPKARALLKADKARPKRNKLGLFYIQLTYEQKPENQQLVIGIDPGDKFEGYSVVGRKDTVLNLMVEAPTHVKAAVKTRRILRHARRSRKWRRPSRSQNWLARKPRLPPSTRSRWEAKTRITRHLCQMLPITDGVVENVEIQMQAGRGRKRNRIFSPIYMGKQHLYTLLATMGLTLHLQEGWETKVLRTKYGLRKSPDKAEQSFTSHAVDAWVLAASVSGAKAPTCRRLWYVVPARLHRRQLHRMGPSKGGIRLPYGGTRSLGFKRGLLVRHPRYGLCTIGGVERKLGRVSLHAYRTNKRLTKWAQPEDCQRLTWVAWRSWLVRKQGRKIEESRQGFLVRRKKRSQPRA
jgi:hypothetical protein